MSSTPSMDLIRAILDSKDDVMPRKYQNAKLDIRTDVSRPYYFVWVTVPRIRRRVPRSAASVRFSASLTRSPRKRP